MEKELRERLLHFIKDELGIEDYGQPEKNFSEAGVDSFQVLEIIIETERAIGKRLNIKDFENHDLASLQALLTKVILKD